MGSEAISHAGAQKLIADLPRLHSGGFLGAGCRAAILDTGVDFDALPGWARVDCVDFTGEGTHDSDPDKHGSRMIRIVLEAAPQAHVISVKIVGRRVRPSRTRLCEVLEWCARRSVHVINVSFGFPVETSHEDRPCDLCRKVNDLALKKNISIIAAVGNRGPFGGFFCPSTARHALAVGAYDVSTRLPTFFSAEAKKGPRPTHLSAPIMGARGDEYYREHPEHLTKIGTSDAAAYVSGGFCVLRSAFPDATAFELLFRVMETADDLGVPLPLQGLGAANFFRAIDSLSPAPLHYAQMKRALLHTTPPRGFFAWLKRSSFEQQLGITVVAARAYLSRWLILKGKYDLAAAELQWLVDRIGAILGGQNSLQYSLLADLLRACERAERDNLKAAFTWEIETKGGERKRLPAEFGLIGPWLASEEDIVVRAKTCIEKQQAYVVVKAGQVTRQEPSGLRVLVFREVGPVALFASRQEADQWEADFGFPLLMGRDLSFGEALVYSKMLFGGELGAGDVGSLLKFLNAKV